MLPALLLLSLGAIASDDDELQFEDPEAGLPEVYTFGHQTGRLAALVFESAQTANSGRSHHHIVLASAWSGRLRWTEGAGCQGEFKVPVGGLIADDPAERKREELGPALAESDRRKVNEHLRARDQLYIDKFPDITYAVQRCTPKADGHHVIHGELTLRGMTRSVALQVTAQEKDGMLWLKGEGSINHTDFGFEPYYALFGQRQNQDRMRITLDVEGMPVGPRSSVAAPLIEAAD